jgi:hypothetical protein
VPPAVPDAALLTSSVGTGSAVVTIILILLIVGVWFYGNRLSSEFSTWSYHHA